VLNKTLCFAALAALAGGPAAIYGQTGNPTYRFITNLGSIDVVLTPNAAPLTVANFLAYMNAGAYTNTIFHRSVPGFVVQAGGYQDPGALPLAAAAPVAIAPNAPVMNEFNVTNAQGTIAMALPSNQPNGGTSQWFFNLVNNGSQLDSQLFTVFGQTNAAGLAVLNRIAAQPVNDYSSLFGADFATLPTTGGNFVLVSSIVPVPSLTPQGFQSAASYAPTSSNGISPGELLVIYGQQLGPAQLTTGNGTFPTTLAGTQVTFSGKPAPIIYTSSGQISVIAPYGIAALPTVNVVVSYQGVQSNAAVFQVKPANPAIFTLNSSGAGDAAIEHFPDYSLIGAANPAAPGDVLILFGEGYGAATPATTLVDGAIVGTTVPVVAEPATALLIDGQPVSTSYFGGAPGLVNGVLQVNFTVPNLAPGSHQIQLQVGARTSPTGVILHTR
jgi:uncharacterized protein (TIGR03437 family)